MQATIIGLLALIFYSNSFLNEYAHDDKIVIVNNEYVQQGLAGIPGILSKDTYDSYYRHLNTGNQLQGGRYRPLSVVTFAVEQQFLGPGRKRQDQLVHDMHIRHVFNVLWYVASLITLLYFLRNVVFKNDSNAAFVATIVFTVHPIHTEVVANVKSRDEILSLLFISATFILAFNYQERRSPWTLIAALFSYFLALLSKEYAITLIVLLPLALYLFNGYSIRRSLLAILPFMAVAAAYVTLRTSIITPMGENSLSEVLNNPYLYASKSEELATEIAVCLKYLKLLIIPHPLSADYSYNSIPYVDFRNLTVWLSLIIHGALTVSMMLLFPLRRSQGASQSQPRDYRSILCFAIAIYLANLLLISNLLFDIGGTMGERLIYHSSAGFAVIVACALGKGIQCMRPAIGGKRALGALIVAAILLAGFKTIARNADWKNDGTLYSADIQTVPNSVLVNNNLAAFYILQSYRQSNHESRQRYLHKAIALLNHALSIHTAYVDALFNRGIAWYKLGKVDKARTDLDTVRRLYPSYPGLPNMYRLVNERS